MTVPDVDRAMLDRRNELTKFEKSLIDLTFNDLYYRGDNAKVILARDDRAAILEAALIRYILSSRSKAAELVRGFRTTRLSEIHQVVLETLYIVRGDGSVAMSSEHPFSTNFVGDWTWTERPDLNGPWAANTFEFIGNYADPTK